MRMESVRKDVEDAFGVLKGRFRILKLPIQLHDKKKIDDVFFTCVALHNMLHDWDDRTFNFAGADGLFVDEEDPAWKRPKVRRANNTWEYARSGEDHSTVGSFFFSDEQVPSYGDVGADVEVGRLVELATEKDTGFRQLQKKLVLNYKIRLEEGSVACLR
jgi:hypothetical protein